MPNRVSTSPVPPLDTGARGGNAGGVKRGLIIAAIALALAGSAAAGQDQPPAHGDGLPMIGLLNDRGLRYEADAGYQLEQNRTPKELLEQTRRFDRQLAALLPQRPGTVDAYVVVAALDSDPVFSREAREAARVLARRYGAGGRTIVLAGADGNGGEPLASGSPDHIAAALARVRELMDPREDVLILYTTSHGAPWGIVYDDGDAGFGAISPTRLSGMLNGLGIRRRMLLISACFSGVFVPALRSSDTAIVTAASADHTSFGCQSDNDWTFFGDALINHALRQPEPFRAAASEAVGLIGGWEKQGRIISSHPQVAIGAGAEAWLAALERQLPPATPPVGRPATRALVKAAAAHH